MADLLTTSSEDVNDGVVAQTTRERQRFYNYWVRWLSVLFPQISPNLQELSKDHQLQVLVAYGRYVRYGNLSTRKGKVRAETVALSFRSISSTLQLDGKSNPLETKEGKFPKKISQLLEGYRRKDPPSRPQLAVPVQVPNHIALHRLGHSSPKQQAIGAMALIAFYYLLRVGEYTYHRPSEKRRTQQFRVCNITFWCNTTKLDINSDQTWLMQHATAATLNISNQKNGIRAQTIHQEAINSHLCPVKALI